MISPIANFYLALVARIQAEVPEINWIDFDLRQLEAFDGERPPVEWPCLLIDFPETDYTQMQGYQQGNMNVQLRLGFDQYENTNGDTPAPLLEQALDYLEIEQKVYLALQAWNAGGTLANAMIRTNTATEVREEDNFRVRRMLYSASFIDDSVTG